MSPLVAGTRPAKSGMEALGLSPLAPHVSDLPNEDDARISSIELIPAHSRVQ